MLTLIWTNPVDPDTVLHGVLVARLQSAAVRDSFVVGARDTMFSGLPDSEHVNVGCIAPPGQTWSLWWIQFDKAGNPAKSNMFTTIFLPSR